MIEYFDKYGKTHFNGNGALSLLAHAFAPGNSVQYKIYNAVCEGNWRMAGDHISRFSYSRKHKRCGSNQISKDGKPAPSFSKVE